ncbi:MAG: hypothetical protein DMG37_20775, partial [Acidobacteria bacterium]
LERDLSKRLDPILTGQLLSEYISQEKRYILRDWEPATLDGGQFVEAATRIIYTVDSGNLNRTRSVDECLRYVEDPSNQNNHSFPERKSALHLCRVLRTIYKFRSDRGAVHIDPSYTANQLDSRLVMDNSRWVLSELLRIFWSGDRKEVARAIREILKHEIPAVGRYEGQLLVQRTDCNAEEEILLLLRVSGETGLQREELGRFVRKTPGRVTQAIQSLEEKRQVIRTQDGAYVLTDPGALRITEELGEKLQLK